MCGILISLSYEYIIKKQVFFSLLSLKGISLFQRDKTVSTTINWNVKPKTEFYFETFPFLKIYFPSHNKYVNATVTES